MIYYPTANHVKWRILVANRMHNREEKAKVIPFILDSRFFYERGMKAYRERNLTLAIKMFQRALHLEPKNEEVICQLAFVYTEIGEFQKSNELLSYILDEINPDMTECYYFIANNYAHLGLFQEAYKWAILYAEKEPYGEFTEENEDLLEMLEVEGEANVNSAQDDLIMKQEKARSFLEKGQLNEAIHQLKSIINDYPDFWSAYNNLALAYFYLGEVDKAKEYLALVLEKNPGNLHALCNLLVFYFYERKDDEVEHLVQKLSSIHPLFLEHRYKLGATLALVGYYDHAFKLLYTLYSQGFDGDDTFYYWLSYSAYFTGNKELAKKCWKRVIQISPDKKGMEPWVEDATLQVEIMEKKLYELYREKKSKQKEGHPKEIDSAFSKLLPKYNDKEQQKIMSFAFQVADYLQVNSENDRLLAEWFHLFVFALKANIKLKNEKAWAAAVHFWWIKRENEKETQANIAKKYHISRTTLAKYIKMLKEINAFVTKEHG